MQHWRTKHLALSWTAYWAVLGIATLWTPVREAVRLSSLPDGHADISVGFDNAVLQFSMREDGHTVLAQGAHLGTIALWLAGPPLLLWLAWLLNRPAPSSPTVNGSMADITSDTPAALRSGALHGINREVPARSKSPIPPSRAPTA